MRGICDAHGNFLTRCILSGDGWRTAHDAIKNALAKVLVEYKLGFTCEVFGLFSSCIPAGPRRDAFLSMKRDRHPGMVPDLRIDGLNDALGDGGAPVAGTQRLGEFKRINGCPTHYSRIVLQGRQLAVERRARTLQREYEDKALHMDRTYGTTLPGQTGPCCDRLPMFGSVLGLVVGHFGECSKDLNMLVTAMAKVAVPRVG
jgi:hypothetical protein